MKVDDLDSFTDEVLEQLRVADEMGPASVLNDYRLEDAFKEPEFDAEGYSESSPAIWSNYSYGQTSDGVKILSAKSTSICSNLYSRYLDEEALVWDSVKEKLFLYSPDEDMPRLAFKGDRWRYAKKLTFVSQIESPGLTLYDLYLELSAMLNATE